MSTQSLPELDADRALARSLREHRPDLEIAHRLGAARPRPLDDPATSSRRWRTPCGSPRSDRSARVRSARSARASATRRLSIRLLAGIDVDSVGAVARDVGTRPRRGRVRRASALRSTPGPTRSSTASAHRTRPTRETSSTRFDQFLFDHGARGQNEYDVYAISWEVKPRIALAAIDLMRRSDASQAPTNRNTAAIAERDRIAADIRAQIAGDPETAGLFEAAMTSAGLFLSGRERAKTNVVTVINEMRVALREFGRRLVERGVLDEVAQVFMVTDDELNRLRHDPDSMAGVIRERWAVFQSLFDYEPVFVVNGVVPALSDMRRRGGETFTAATVGTVLTGSAGSGGVATGRARVILDAADPAGLEPGDILVAPQTDPSWVPLFVPASGVVVNVGAMGSHAMIVSRELGVPCVASVADATLIIPDGATITVDGNAGTVTIVALAD